MVRDVVGPGRTGGTDPPGAHDRQPAFAAPVARASDPVVRTTSLRGYWPSRRSEFRRESAILVSTSSDGLRWSAPFTGCRRPNDGDGIVLTKWIACDNGATSPYRGRCYLSYSDIETLRRVTQTSTDGGARGRRDVGSPDNDGRRGIVGPAAPAPQPVALRTGRSSSPSSTTTSRSCARPTAAPRLVRNQDRLVLLRRLRGPRSGPFPSAEVGADGTVMWRGRLPPAPELAPGTSSSSRNPRTASTGRPPTRIPLGGGNHIIDGLPPKHVRPGRVAVAFDTETGGRLDVRLVWSTDGGRTWSRPLRLSPERMPVPKDRLRRRRDGRRLLLDLFAGSPSRAGLTLLEVRPARRASARRRTRAVAVHVALPPETIWNADRASSGRPATRLGCAPPRRLVPRHCGCSGQPAWRNIIQAAYLRPGDPLAGHRRRRVAGVGVNAIVPARGGEVVRVFLPSAASRAAATRRSPRPSSCSASSTSSSRARSSSGLLIAGLLPGADELGPSFDFGWAVDNYGTVLTVIGSCVVILLVVCSGLPSTSATSSAGRARASPRSATAATTSPRRALAGWTGRCRFVAVLFFLSAFGLPATLDNALLVQVSMGLGVAAADQPGRHRHRAGLPALHVQRRRRRPHSSSRSASACG